jgi:hypothetical protein
MIIIMMITVMVNSRIDSIHKTKLIAKLRASLDVS